MNSPLILSVLAGTGLGAGLWLGFVRLPVMRSVRFADRIAPLLRTVDVRSKLLREGTRTATPFGPLERILRPVLSDAVGWLNKFNPGTAALLKRLARAGRRQSSVEFRAQQVLWAVAGLTLGVVLTVALATAGRWNPLLSIVLTLGLAAGGFLARDYLLSLQIARREAKMLTEFPALAELMALAVGAGESMGGALERVCRSARGELVEEFAAVLAQTRAGTPLLRSLQEFSNRVQLPPIIRFVDGITVAVERGTPLADVLRAQAQDVRDMAKRDLMETAGKKEIAMMVPLVFGVLPLTVVFAVFPGLALISLGV